MPRIKQQAGIETIQIDRSKINKAIGYALALYESGISELPQSTDRASARGELSEFETIVLKQEIADLKSKQPDPIEKLSTASNPPVYQHIVDGHDTLTPDDVELGLPEDCEPVIAPEPKKSKTAGKATV